MTETLGFRGRGTLGAVSRLLMVLMLAVAALAASPAFAAKAKIDLGALRKSADAGNAQAQYDYGMALCCGYREKNPVDGVKWFRKAAEQGHVEAQAALGWSYMIGQGVDRDDAEAVRWLGLAAEKGNSSAQNNLGIMYAEGRGVERDAAAAEAWFRRAAAKGARDALKNLEALLKRGGTPQGVPVPKTPPRT